VKWINQAWPFLLSEHFKAEHNITSQPGAFLSVRPSTLSKRKLTKVLILILRTNPISINPMVSLSSFSM
jgi:hypothetical protein